MNAKNHDSRHGDLLARVAARLDQGLQHEPARRSTDPPGWISESIGLDSRVSPLLAANRFFTASYPYERVIADEAPWRVAAAVAPDRPLLRPPPEPLQPATSLWLDQLPTDVRPREVPRLFPRIANKLCSLWANPALCNRYLSSLLMDTRDGAREGFPLAVAGELVALFGWAESESDNGLGRVERR